MKHSLVLTVIGPDRPGLVETLAQTISEHQANWLESRMARLAGKFAGVLRVDVPHDQTQPLTEALGQLQSAGLHVVVESADDQPTETSPRTLTLTFIGHDRPGIVRDISHALAQHGVNVIELHTQVSSAPMTGEPLFKANATLHAPSSIPLDQLRDQLDQVAHQLDIDLTLDEAADASA
ncbi:MAG: glycine cleavage system protein R [Phycisphaeraceae bacterium]